MRTPTLAAGALLLALGGLALVAPGAEASVTCTPSVQAVCVGLSDTHPGKDCTGSTFFWVDAWVPGLYSLAVCVFSGGGPLEVDSCLFPASRWKC